jgi:hypothetical protein
MYALGRCRFCGRLLDGKTYTRLLGCEFVPKVWCHGAQTEATGG